jgi:hypothetical protein
MRDEAVSPVIAVMLILAAIVTFMSVWNAIYVPSMKESSEVEHLGEVETAFVHFSSDLYFAASSHQDHLSFSEPVPLGGGDVVVNLIKSSGTIQVQNENNPVYMLTFSDGTVVTGTIVNFFYEPVGNFWQDQGYSWQYGYINVTKYGTLSTPLNYYNMTDISNAFSMPGSPLYEFASSMGSARYTVNQTEVPGNCSAVSLLAVNFSASSRNFVSSNGYGTLTLTTNATPVILSQSITTIMITSDGSPFGNATAASLNASLSDLTDHCQNFNYETTAGGSGYYSLNQVESPISVNLTVIKISVGIG